jgi:error-prone DNA polymerase
MGPSHPDELVEAAHALGLPALALTDRDGVHGVVRAHMKAKELGLPLLIGADVSIDDGSQIVLLAQTRAGYAHLCRLLTAGRLRSAKGSSVVSWDEVCTHADDLIALLSSTRSALVAAVEPRTTLEQLKDAFRDRLHALLVRHRCADEMRLEERLRHRAARLELPIVAGHEVLYHAPTRRPLHDVLTCIRHKVKLTTAGRRIRPNALHALCSPTAFAKLFADDPSAIVRTHEIRERCTFSLDQLHYRYPSERLPDGRTSAQHLRAVTMSGAHGRYGGTIPDVVRAQLDKELALIVELDYCGYFLTMVEIVAFCRGRGILCQGRGSAANSAVCYCLGITAIDPVRMGICCSSASCRANAHEPPDIDPRHRARTPRGSHRARLREVRPRARPRWSRNVVRYRPRSAVRDVGKALGFEELQLDRLSKIAVAPRRRRASPR